MAKLTRRDWYIRILIFLILGGFLAGTLLTMMSAK